jgi:hypothetical protein
MVNSMVLITVTGDHDRPEWLIRINGIRIVKLEVVLASESSEPTPEFWADLEVQRRVLGRCPGRLLSLFRAIDLCFHRLRFDLNESCVKVLGHQTTTFILAIWLPSNRSFKKANKAEISPAAVPFGWLSWTL